MAPTTDNNARDKRCVLRPNPATFLRDATLYMTTIYAIIRKRCLNYTACCLFNRNPAGVPIREHGEKNVSQKQSLPLNG